MNITTQSERIQAYNALFFMRSHPAFSPDILGDSLFDGAWFHMAKCCKRGKSDSCRTYMNVYRGDEGWENFKFRFDKEYKDDTETPKELQSVHATYKEVYGEPWKFDHIEYWYETTFFVYTGDPYSQDECWDYKNWARYAGPENGANTFEEALIKWARQIRRTYGSFNIDKDFFTEAEKKNHKERDMFGRDWLEKKSPFIKIDPEYIEVTNGVKNLRWLEWFIETDYCKKNWDFNMEEFKGHIASLKKMPAKRKKLVERYS